MAMLITMKNGVKYNWLCYSPYSAPQKSEVKSIEASSTELDFVKRHFTKMPIATGDVVCWEGPYAQFIHSNMMSAVKKVYDK